MQRFYVISANDPKPRVVWAHSANEIRGNNPYLIVYPVGKF